MDGKRDCDVCKRDNKKETATVFCCKCRNALCNSCLNLHKRFSALDEHLIVAIGECEDTDFIEFDESCKIHVGKFIEAFCLDHDELLCAVCLVKGHRKCDNVKTIEEVVDFSIDAETRKVVGNSMSAIQKEVANIVKEYDQNIEHIINDRDSVKTEFEEFVKDAKSALDKGLEIFKTSVDDEHSSKQRELTARLNLVKNFQFDINKWQLLLTEVQVRGSRQQMFVTSEKIKYELTHTYTQLRALLQSTVSVDISLDLDKKRITKLKSALDPQRVLTVSEMPSSNSLEAVSEIDKFIEQLKSNTINASNVVPEDDKTEENKNVDASDNSEASPVSSIEKRISAESLSNLSDEAPSNVDLLTASVKLDRFVKFNASFKGGTFLKNGHLLLADHSGRKIVHFNSELEIVQIYDMDGKPTDVAVDNMQVVFIAVNMISICEYKFKSDLDLVFVKRIRAPKGTWGISVLDDKLIVGTHNGVEILTRDGTCIRKTQKNGIETFVCVSPVGNRFFYKNGKYVVCQNSDYKLEYQCKFLTEVSGIALDYDGNIYVSRRHSQTIYQIPRVGLTGRVLVDCTQTRAPYALMFHPWNNTFVVTSSVDNDGFLVYRFVES